MSQYLGQKSTFSGTLQYRIIGGGGGGGRKMKFWITKNTCVSANML